ncbi:MAG: NADH-quinone oxidoreductase subunit M [Spirochaetia bacterium]|nr:NADH-quinone oxidoreductase subunit M [Spirochaetia bacterium]
MLTLSILAPIVAVIIIGLLPASKSEKPSKTMMYISMAASLISMAASFIAASGFSSVNPDFQLTEVWFTSVENGINWSFALDGLSLGLYILTAVLFPIGIYYSYVSFETQSAQGEAIRRQKLFYSSLLILETSVLGVFAAQNLIVFYVFWELMLVPMVLLIGIWGGKNKKYATIKFFLYTFGGSVFLIFGIIAILYYQTQSKLSFDLTDNLVMSLSQFPHAVKVYLFWAFIISFLIKIPVFPVHTWLPHAHTEAPTVGSVILAGVLLKMGTYGVVRFSLPFFPLVSQEYADLFMVIGVIGIIYGAWLAWAQTDIKKLVAYSSVSHMGYIVLGMFSGNIIGLTGAYMQMINHGISTGLLFLLVGIIYDRTHTREIDDYGGLAKLSPLYAIIFMIATLSSVGLPGTNGFVGEFLILLGTFLANKTAAVLAVSGVIFGAVYMLHLYKQVFFGEPSEKLLKIKEKISLNMTFKEVLLTVPFIVMIFWLGVKPGLLLDTTDASLKKILNTTVQAELAEKNLLKSVKAANIKTEIKKTEEGL